MDTQAIQDILQAGGGGNIDIQSYRVGTGGMTRVNVQPALRRGYDPTPVTLVGGTIAGLLIVAVLAAIVAVVIMVAVAVSTDGTTNAGVSDALVAKCFYGWVIATIIGGVLGALYSLFSN
jgi:hypothetical protein